MTSELFTLTHLLEPKEVGEEFRTWPWHVTVVPPVDADYDSGLHLERVVEPFSPIPIEMGGIDRLTPDIDLTIRRVDVPEGFNEVRRLLTSRISQCGIKMDERLASIEPYVSAVRGELPPAGERFSIECISVVVCRRGICTVIDQLPLRGTK